METNTAEINSTAILERVDNLAVISMNYPPHNLLGPQLLGGLMEALQKAVDTGARAILLKTALKNFSAGADLELFTAAFAESQKGGEGEKESSGNIDTLTFLEFMEQLPIPVVASIRGTVFGGGLEIALACDMIIAAKSTRFGSVEVTIGIAPIMGAVQRLVQRIGVARAKEFAMLGRRHDAETMERIGLINLCVADPDLDEVSLNYAQQLANGPTVAHRAIKQLANLAQARGVEAADQAMEELIAPIFKSEDAKRGVQALGTTGPGSASFEGN